MTAGKSFGHDLAFHITSVGNSTIALTDAVDISKWVMSVDGLPGERDMADVTCGGGAETHQWLAGLMNAEVTLECLFDQTTGSAYDTFSGWMSDTSHRHFYYAPAGVTAGYPKFYGAAMVKSVTLGAKPLEPLAMQVSMVIDSTLAVGVCT